MTEILSSPTAALEAELAAVKAERDGLLGRVATLEGRVEQQRAFIETLYEGIWVVDPEWNTTFVNARLGELLGVAPAEMIGKNLTEFVYPEDLPVLLEQTARRAQGEPESHEFRFRRADGTAVWTLVNTSPLTDAQGRFTGAVAAIADINEKKGAEQALKAHQELLERITDHVPALIAYHDCELRYRWVNPEFSRLLGVGQAALPGRPVPDAFPEADTAFAPIMRRVLETGEIFTARDFAFHYQLDGQPRATYWDLSFVPVMGPDGRPDGILGFGVEVSDRYEMERLQHEQIETLHRADKVKDEFLSVVSHELRTPIHVLMGFLALLQRGLAGPVSESQAELLDKMHEVTVVLSSLVNDILDLSQMQSGTFSILAEPLRFEALAGATVAQMAPLADRKQQQLTYTAHDETPTLSGDGRRLGQVLTNLVANAIKFTPEGGTIQVSSRVEAGAFRCEVTDTGPGMAEADLERIFERFTQLDMSLTRKAGGIGLGLAIAKALVTAHGGEIGAISRLGHGSTVWFTLPLAHPAAS